MPSRGAPPMYPRSTTIMFRFCSSERKVPHQAEFASPQKQRPLTIEGARGLLVATQGDFIDIRVSIFFLESDWTSFDNSQSFSVGRRPLVSATALMQSDDPVRWSHASPHDCLSAVTEFNRMTNSSCPCLAARSRRNRCQEHVPSSFFSLDGSVEKQQKEF